MSDILDLIDGALADTAGPDAMRWTPKRDTPDPLGAMSLFTIMDDICGWLTANGITPRDVPIHEVPVITDGHIECEVSRRDEAGHPYFDPDTNDLATERIRMPLRVEPPEVLSAWLAGEVRP